MAFGTAEFVLGNPAQSIPFLQSADSTTSTWAYANGSVTITTTEPGDAPLVLNVGAGGRVLTSAAIGDDGDHDLFILTRLR